MEKKYKFCQSCMMPLKQDPEGSGSNADGSKSLLYCSYCYQNGQFTQPDISVGDMRDLVIDQLAKMKYPRIVAKFMTMGMKNLVRWKN